MIQLIAVCGLPGTGKTAYATRLSHASGAVRLSRDEIRLHVFQNPDFSASEKQAVFRMMLEVAGELLSEGKSVILEGMTFSRRRDRDAVRDLARTRGAKAIFVLCTCPEPLALERILDDANHPASDRTAELYHEVKARFEPLGADELHIVVDTTNPLSDEQPPPFPSPLNP
jgi:predicted kinase